MNSNPAPEIRSNEPPAARKSQTDLLVADLVNEFPGMGSCEIRVAVLQAEEIIWPKKDAYVLLDRARDLLRRGTA